MPEETSEDYCFICKDGGLLIVCDYSHCLKSYHPECLNMDAKAVETDSRHSCHVCTAKDPKFRCICCPYSVCPSCIEVVEFVRVKEEIGLCSECFKIAFLFENNIDEDDDGDKIDFSDRETYECLFKEYWEIMKENKSITVEDLQMATVLLKQRKCGYKGSEVELSDDSDDYDAMVFRVKKSQKKGLTKKMSKKIRQKRFTSWGSKELIRFLTSLGQDTHDPVPQSVVCDIIYNYIREKELVHSKKKKIILCDEKLHALFHRKSINRFKISDMLDKHFAENQSEEDVPYDFPTDSVFKNGKKGFFSKVKLHKSELSVRKERDKSDRYPFASITTDNIKLVYLRRSLIESFLQDPNTFEDKVKNAYVRVRSGLNDPNALNCSFQLMIITGVERTQHSYNIQGVATDILLIVSDTRSVRISMLSDEVFSEDECDNLRYKINKGIIKRPTVVDLSAKAIVLHKEIVNHGIEKDLIKLQHLIDHANEKGWRRELFEFVEKKELLETPAERTRLLKKFPEVTRDEEVEAEAVSFYFEDAEVENIGSVSATSEQLKEGSSISETPRLVPFKKVYTRQSTTIRRVSGSCPSQSSHEDAPPDPIFDLPISLPRDTNLALQTLAEVPCEDIEITFQTPSLSKEDALRPGSLQEKLEKSKNEMGLSLQTSLMFVEDPLGPQKLEDPLGPEKLRDNLEVQGSAMNGVEVEFEETEPPLQVSPMLVEDLLGPPRLLDKDNASLVEANVMIPCEGLRVLPTIAKGCLAGLRVNREPHYVISFDLDDMDVEVAVESRNTSSTTVIIN